jgi:hypothetical protein
MLRPAWRSGRRCAPAAAPRRCSHPRRPRSRSPRPRIELRASAFWLTSCWYWPTPIDFGIDLDQFGQRVLQAAGDRHRAAQATSRSGNSARPVRRPNTPRRRLPRPRSWSARSSGWRLIRSAASLSVSRLAVPLPMAISSTPCLAPEAAMVAIEPSQSRRGSCGIDGGGVEQLAGGVDHRHLHAGADAGVEAHGDARAGRRGQQQVLQVAAKTRIASSSARSRSSFISSVRGAASLTFQAQRAVSAAICRPRGPGRRMPNAHGDALLAGGSRGALLRRSFGSVSSARRSMPSLRPRSSASARCEGMLATGSRSRTSRGTWRPSFSLPRRPRWRTRQHAVFAAGSAQLAEQFGVFGEALHQDLARAVEHRLGVGTCFSAAGLGVEVFRGFALRASASGRPAGVGQRLDAGLAGDLRLGAALLLVGQVEVFEALLGVSHARSPRSSGRQLALLLDAGEMAARRSSSSRR